MRSPLKNFNRPVFSSFAAQAGYSLLEIGVVLAIAGIFVASGLQVLKLYNTQKSFQTTDINMTSLVIGIQEYLEANGHYPCPAPLDAPRNNAAYGMETDCDDISTAVGTYANGLYIEESLNPVMIAGVPTNVRVRRGAVPFRVLNQPESKAYDGFGHRIEYVVTERLASPSLLADFDPSHGGIMVTDSVGALAVPGMTHMLLISRGKNGAAAYSRDGVQVSPCPATGKEPENCNTATDDKAIYISDIRNLAQADYFDDIVSYRAAVNRPLWRATDTSKVDITDLVVAGGGVGAGDEINDPYVPKLRVFGAEKDIRAQGDFHLSEICDESGSGCFPPELVGGTGMSCPPGEYMTGIQSGLPQCASVLANACPPGQFMSGVDAQYRPICSNPPAACDPTNVTLCGDPTTLPAAFQGAQQVVYGGVNRYLRYRCNNSVWQAMNWGGYNGSNYGGNCTCGACTPATGLQDDVGCPSGTSGTNVRTRDRICPPASDPYCSRYVNVTYDNQCDCNCTAPDADGTPGCVIAGWPGSPQNETDDCDAGFNSGQKTRTCPQICNGSGSGTEWANTIGEGCTAWDDSSCQCITEDPQTDQLSCPWGFSGTGEYREKYWQCPGGPSAPGSWDSSWTVVTPASCSCDPIVNPPYQISCASAQGSSYGFGPGFTGNITLQDSTTCPTPAWQTAMLSHTCSTLTCSRSTSGSASETATQFVGVPATASCTCGSDPAPCYETLGGGSYQNYYSCQCAPNN